MSISLIIVDYKKAKKVVENVKGIMQQEGIELPEILIWDNSEDPANAKILQTKLGKMKNVHLHISEKNVGYSKANNALAKQATGDFFCFVNPDIVWPETNTVAQLLEYLHNNKKAGIVAPRQLEPNGEDALSIRQFPNFFLQILRRTPLKNIAPFASWVQHDEMRHVDRTQTQTVDWVQSSFLMISKSLWEAIGGFNERYFLFLADTELCKKVWERGRQVVYYPKTTVKSDGERCSDGGVQDFFSSKPMQIHLKDSLRYFLG